MITKEQMKQAAEKAGLSEYDFTDEIIDDLFDESNGSYDDQKKWFDDLFHYGCISGMVAKFVYHDDCKDFYIKHIDSMEQFKEDLEAELCEPITDRNHLPHYTFLCWLIYEETARRIAGQIWPEDF